MINVGIIGCGFFVGADFVGSNIQKKLRLTLSLSLNKTY